MKLNRLMEILKEAEREYGNVNVSLMDSETGRWDRVECVIKLHPYTGPHGCMNRGEPVDMLAITTDKRPTEDLVVGTRNAKASTVELSHGTESL